MRSVREREVAAALLLDSLLGELPEPLHPTVWMGRAISACAREASETKKLGVLYIKGAFLALTLPALAYIMVQRLLGLAPGRSRCVLEAALISTTLAMRGLGEAAGTVERELRAGDLERARAGAAAMVGRDTADLPASEVARAAVESVAENTSDGVLAPMLYGLLFGAPGALAYRAVNTLDSMVGYRAYPYAEFGWASARLDDIANLAPARITALIVATVSGRPFHTLMSAWRYGSLTQSPNAGRVEAAFAGALGTRLGGPNSYGGVIREGPILGNGRPPGPEEIWHSVRLMRRCCALFVVAALLAERIRRG